MVEGFSTHLIKNQPRHAGSWWRVLMTGLLFYFAGLVVMVLTDNSNLLPTVILADATTPTIAIEPSIASLEYDNQMRLRSLDRESSHVIA